MASSFYSGTTIVSFVGILNAMAPGPNGFSFSMDARCQVGDRVRGYVKVVRLLGLDPIPPATAPLTAPSPAPPPPPTPLPLTPTHSHSLPLTSTHSHSLQGGKIWSNLLEALAAGAMTPSSTRAP